MLRNRTADGEDGVEQQGDELKKSRRESESKSETVGRNGRITRRSLAALSMLGGLGGILGRERSTKPIVSSILISWGHSRSNLLPEKEKKW